MTATYNINSVSLLLSVLCLGIMFMGGWYFQSSIVELRTLVANQQDIIMEQKKEIKEQQEVIMEQKKEITELNEKLDKILLQQQFEKIQSKVASYRYNS